MSVISEQELTDILKSSKDVVLFEPIYTVKHIPLGLAKISTFVKQNGGKTHYRRQYMNYGEDLICITSLFTYDINYVFMAIQNMFFLNPNANIVVGGISATLIPDHIQNRFKNIKIFKGYSKALDLCPPDYSIDYGREDPWDKMSHVFTSRGCPNRCQYCAVWRLEPDSWMNPTWKEHISDTLPYVTISDNNMSSLPISRIEDIVRYCCDNNKKVCFDNGFDCKFITDDMAKLMSNIKYFKSGMRLAFDRIEEDGVFQEAIRKLIANGVPAKNILAFVLFNFNDTPKEAEYRANECVKLGIRPYPQQYVPLNKKTRRPPFISNKWTEKLVKTFRHFWLMAGYYTKMSFYDFVSMQDETNGKYKLDDESKEKLYAN